MSVTINRDARVFRRKVARVLQQRPDARAAVLRDMGGLVVRRAAATAKQDTRRNVRGIIMAGNAAGATSMSVPGVQASKYASKYAEILDRQLLDVDEMIGTVAAKKRAWYDSKNRKPDKHYRKMERTLDKLAKRRDRIIENIDRLHKSGGGVIVIGASATNKATGGQFFHGQGERGSGVARVVQKVFGGTGRIQGTGDASVLILHNLEPHASIVESREGNMRGALSAVRGLGVKKLGRKYAVRAAKGTQMAR